jgi:hypothetical protein
MDQQGMTVMSVFRRCVEAIREGSLIERESSRDKEFHFQDWFRKRLVETGLNFDQGGRNSYPDFALVRFTDGYEIKGLAYPGRDASFDSNSQVPTGLHNGRTIYYVFGRYPKQLDGNAYPVLDLVVCHGDFLNVDHDYRHKNKSVKGFGSYGDILIRDRKMYVVPTPFRLVEGVAHQQTLILPTEIQPGKEFFELGTLQRIEAAQMVVGYAFDLQTNSLVPRRVPNPDAGKAHGFRAWRLKGSNRAPVAMRNVDSASLQSERDRENYHE